MRETCPERVWGRFWARSGELLGRLGNGVEIVQKMGLESMELGGFWLVVAPFGLGIPVVRATGPKFIDY